MAKNLWFIQSSRYARHVHGKPWDSWPIARTRAKESTRLLHHRHMQLFELGEVSHDHSHMSIAASAQSSSNHSLSLRMSELFGILKGTSLK